MNASDDLTATKFQSQGTSGDFTKAAVWYPNGTWVDPAPGPS